MRKLQKNTGLTFQTDIRILQEKKIPPLVLSTRGFTPNIRRHLDNMTLQKEELPETHNTTRCILNNSQKKSWSYSDSLRAGRSGDRIPVGTRFTAPIQTSSEAHPASCTMGAGSFPGVKRPGRGADHPPPYSVPRYTERSTAIPLLSPKRFQAYTKGVKP
jgi:hypothetical protein